MMEMGGAHSYFGYCAQQRPQEVEIETVPLSS